LQKATLQNTTVSTTADKPTAQISPTLRELVEPQNDGPVIPLVDLTADDPLLTESFLDNILENAYDPVTERDLEIIDGDLEIIEDQRNVSPVLARRQNLEPLDPDVEYRNTVTQIFIDLEQYARSVFLNP